MSINNLGHVVGKLVEEPGTEPPRDWFDFFWRPQGGMVILTPQGCASNMAYIGEVSLNNRDEMVGRYFNIEHWEVRAYYWNNETRLSVDLNSLVENLPPGISLARANSINDHGMIIGYDQRGIGFLLTPIITSTPPVANAGPDQTIHAGATVNLNGSGSYDQDGDTVTNK